jgi:hypothetical protein
MSTLDPAPLVCLFLAFPAALEEDVLDVCHELDEVPGFTVFSADGFVSGASLRTTAEAVLGRARRRTLLMVVAQPAVARIVAALRVALPTPDVAYWVVPVLEFGRLA